MRIVEPKAKTFGKQSTSGQAARQKALNISIYSGMTSAFRMSDGEMTLLVQVDTHNHVQ